MNKENLNNIEEDTEKINNTDFKTTEEINEETNENTSYESFNFSEEDMKQYGEGKTINESELLKKIMKVLKRAGSSLIYLVLILFYTLKDNKVPIKTKVIIIGALAYFITPLDMIIDAIPLLGFTDDLAAVLAAITCIVPYVTDDIDKNARDKVSSLFNSEFTLSLKDFI